MSQHTNPNSDEEFMEDKHEIDEINTISSRTSTN